MDSVERRDLTKLIAGWQRGDPSARNELLGAVYDELRRRAGMMMAGERSDHTLQPTALVHEAFMRLERSLPDILNDRVHFYSIASRIMRQILVDHARGHLADKRGGSTSVFSLAEIDVPLEERAASLVALHEALNELEAVDEQQAAIVEMRFFGGMGNREIAETLEISERTVIREWNTARLWLHRSLVA